MPNDTPEKQQRNSFVRDLLSNFTFAVSQGLAAASTAPRGRGSTAALAGALQAPQVAEEMERQRQAEALARDMQLFQAGLGAQNQALDIRDRARANIDAQQSSFPIEPQSPLPGANQQLVDLGLPPAIGQRVASGTLPEVAPVEPSALLQQFGIQGVPGLEPEGHRALSTMRQLGLIEQEAAARAAGQEAGTLGVQERLGVGPFAPATTPDWELRPVGNTLMAFRTTPDGEIESQTVVETIETTRGTGHELIDKGEIVYFYPETGETVRSGIRAESAADITDSMRVNAGFLGQAKASNETATEIEDLFLQGDVSTVELLTSGSTFAAILDISSPEARQLEQSIREFSEAWLRPITGAAIQSFEYDNVRRTYFPMPNDTAQIIAQKRLARQRVLDALELRAGFLADASDSTGRTVVTDSLRRAYLTLSQGNAQLALDAMRRDGLVD